MINRGNYLWSNSKKHIQTTIENIKINEKKLKIEIRKLEEKITKIKGDISYADREDKIYLREELNSIRNNYEVISREVNFKDTELFIKSPYFCKVSTEDDGLYISKYKKDIENNVVLFTDNIAKLRFYNVDETEKINGHRHTIKEKIDYIIEESNLKHLTHYKKDLTYTYDGENIQVIKGEIEKIEKALKPGCDAKFGMQEIIDRMQLEQDTAMRAPEVGITLINGGAGTGKTNIAIHRLRYLLNEFEGMFKEKNMALICFNVALKEYLNNVMSELNLKDIEVFSYDKWAYKLMRKYSDITFVSYNIKLDKSTEEAYKSNKYIEVLYNYIKSLKDDIEYEIINSEILKYYISENYIFNDIITIEDIFDLRDEILESIKRMKDFKKMKIIIEEELKSILKKYYVTKIDFDNKTFILKATNILYKVYTSEELKEKLKATAFTYNNLMQNKVNKYELYSVMYLLSLVSGNINKELKIYDHITIDEVQDFLPIQLKTLKNISAYSMTLAGDINQKIFNTGMNKWDGLGIKVDNFYTLNEVHRSTIQTINLANAIIGKNYKIINDNRGLKPVLINVCGLTDNMEKLTDHISRIKIENKDASIVVVYPDNRKLNYINEELNKSGITSYIALKDEWDFRKDVSVTNYHQVKGLEFDYVFIVGLNEFESYGYINKDKLLYTLLTRARKRVYMYYTKYLPNIFRKIDNSLYEKII